MSEVRAEIESLIEDTLEYHKDEPTSVKAAYVAEELLDQREGRDHLIEYLKSRGHLQG